MPTGFDIFAAVFAANALPGGVAANRNRNVAHQTTAEAGEAPEDDAQELQRLKTGQRRSQSRSSSTPPPSIVSR